MIQPAVTFGILVFAESSSGLWVMAAVGFFVAAVVGFAAGVHYAKFATQRAVERVKSSLTKLYAHVVTSIEDAQSACQTLEAFPGLSLSLEQLGRLEEKRGSLLEAVQRIVEGQQLPPEPEPAVVVPAIDWVLEPQHAVTKLPDRAAFDANRELLSRVSAEGGFSCGLLLVRMDRADHLKTRFGIAGVQSFTRSMAGLICRSMRDADIACQYAADTFAVLMPGVTEEAARETAETVRRTIRHHNFRNGENGPEVLVTASFGLTVFAGGDSPDLAVSRAENALRSSRKQGRNQLFFDGGRALVACTSDA